MIVPSLLFLLLLLQLSFHHYCFHFIIIIIIIFIIIIIIISMMCRFNECAGITWSSCHAGVVRLLLETCAEILTILFTSSKHVSVGMRLLGLGIGGLSHQSCMSLHIWTNNIVGGFNTKSFCQQNIHENVICKMITVLYRPLCVTLPHEALRRIILLLWTTRFIH